MEFIIRSHACTYAPQQNGLAERKNRQLLEVVRASLFGMNMPLFYWGEAVKSAAYLINRTPSQLMDFQTPQQKCKTREILISEKRAKS